MLIRKIFSRRYAVFGQTKRLFSQQVNFNKWKWRFEQFSAAYMIGGGLVLSSFLFFNTQSFAHQLEEKEEEEEVLSKNTDMNRMISHASPTPKSTEEYQRILGFKTEDKVANYDYVIVGTGTSAQAACEFIKQSDPSGSVLIISDYSQLSAPDITANQYSEQSLSPELQGCFDRWRRQLSPKIHSMVIRNDKKTDVLLTMGSDSVVIKPEDKLITLKKGTRISYKSCLLATSGKIRSHYVLNSTIQYKLKQKVNPLTSLQDFKVLENYIKESENQGSLQRKVVVVGGGFLGTEISSSLAELNEQVKDNQKVIIYQVYFEENPLDTYMPKYLSRHVKQCLKEKGILPLPNRLVSDVFESSSKVQAKLVTLSNEQQLLEHDYMVLASTRVDPDVEIALSSGFEIDQRNGGVVVNSSLEAFRDVFVSGTSASFFNQSIGRRRVSVYDHAINSGLTAARNMVASTTRSSDEGIQPSLVSYKHLPAFRCDLKALKMRFECVGEIDSRLQTVGVWLARRNVETGQPSEDTDYRRGLVYYLRNSRVVGVMCCNASECLDSARNLINENKPFHDDCVVELKKKIKLGPDFWLRIAKT